MNLSKQEIEWLAPRLITINSMLKGCFVAGAMEHVPHFISRVVEPVIVSLTDSNYNEKYYGLKMEFCNPDNRIAIEACYREINQN